MHIWVSVAVGILAVHLAASEARRQLARSQDGQVWFPVTPLVRWAYLIALPGSIALVLLGPNDNWLATTLLLGFAALWIVTWPRTIVLDDLGVKDIMWGGLRTRSASWPEVAHAIRMEIDSEREVHIVLKNGKVIKHTKVHIDRNRFMGEVRKRVEVLGGPPRIL